MSFIVVSHKYPEKKHEKNTKLTFSDVPTPVSPYDIERRFS